MEGMIGSRKGGIEECGEQSEKAAPKQLSSGGNKQAGAWSRTPRRRWSSSTDLEIETTEATTVLSRSYSATTAVVAVDGGVMRRQQARGGDDEEAIGRRRGDGNKPGAGARLSRKLKEQRARFYIVRRCVAMLVCWNDTDDNDD